jgi:flagellar biogenesis protein FliO
MPWSFWEAYAIKLLILGLMLAALYALGRRLKGVKFFARGADRYVTVIESTMLSQHTAVHLLRVGTRYLLIGGGNAGLFKLAEFRAAEEVPQTAKYLN